MFRVEKHVVDKFHIKDGVKQDRQCTCNVTLRCVHETTFALKSNEYYIFLCLVVCVCARGLLPVAEYMRVRACVRVCVGGEVSGCGCTNVGVCLLACRFTYPVYHKQVQ